jgi:acyl carrier protein
MADIMKDRVLGILKEVRPEFDFGEGIDFIESGMLDSLDIINLVVSLDSHFAISIDGLDILPENFSSIQAIVKLLNKNGVTE